jgi:hypothetical protein
MDNQPANRSVYLVRRIVAALVILLLLALFVPQACQALFGSGGTGSGAQDTADVNSSSGDDEENATNEETDDATEEVAIQEDATNHATEEQSDSSGESGASDGTRRSFGGVEANEDEYSGIENIEIDAEPAGAAEVPEEVAIGEVDEVGPIPVIDAGGQQPIQPMLPVEWTVPVGSITPIEPAILAEPIAAEVPIVPEEPIFYYYEDIPYYDYWAYYYEDIPYYEDPAYYDYLAYYYEDPSYYEEQSMAVPDFLDPYDTAAFETVSEEEGGSSGAYAAISSG